MIMETKKAKKTFRRSTLAALLDQNTKEINKKLSISLAFCSIAMVALIMLTTVFPVFDFGRTLIMMLAILGPICTLSPIVLYYLKTPDLFLKIYIMISMQVLVSMLGTQHAIGIYITFMLVPIASCAYLSKLFTGCCTVCSYVAMAFSLYFNTAQRYEVTTGLLSHSINFRNYLIGFTFEFIIIFLFLEVFLNRAKQIATDQQKLVTDLQSERESYELLLEGTNDILFKYTYETDCFTASDRVIGRDEEQKHPFEIMPFIGSTELPDKMYELISRYVLEKVMMPEYTLEIPAENDEDGRDVYGVESGYFEIEGRVIYDTNGKADRYIGLIRDISAIKRDEKRREIEKQTDKLTGMFYYEYMKNYICRLPECYHDGMMLSITVLNFDKIVETYGFIYGDVILKKIKQILFSKVERPEFCCRLHGAHFLFFKPSLEYVDGFQIQQDLLEALGGIYVGEKEPNSLKCEIIYGQVNINNMDEFTNFNRLDYKKSITKKRTRSLFDLLKLDEYISSKEGRERMTECQLFTNSVSDLLRGAKDSESTIKVVFYMISDFFNLDRIVVIQGNIDSGQTNTMYEWTSKPEYSLGDYFGGINSDEAEHIKRMYDDNGYLEIYADNDNLGKENMRDDIRALYERVSTQVLLGAQLWIPTTLSEGEYTGAWHFDRCDSVHYTPIDIFWMSELVSTLMNYIRRWRADKENQAKNEFLSTLSEEIRTPMNAVIELSESSLGNEMSAELKSNLEAIHSAGIDLRNVVNQAMNLDENS
ncbi:MAG: diguanylate cyclase [Lachnospiraceae bacterium]|nr:diguanylate cyclase [Lachnospiraceae bacterium]